VSQRHQMVDRRLSAPQRRVAEVLCRRFAGSQTAMARQLGFTQAAISQVVTGRRPPGPRLLNSIAKLPGVPADWIFLGKGSLPEGQLCRDPRRCFLPLFESLDAAFDRDNQPTAAAVAINVSAVDYSDSRFVLRIPADWNSATTRSKGIRRGDLLVFETDRRIWAERNSILERKVCAISASREPARRLDLGYVHHCETRIDTPEEIACVQRFGTQQTPLSRLTEGERMEELCREVVTSCKRVRRVMLDGLGTGRTQLGAEGEGTRLRVHVRRRSALEAVSLNDVLAYLVVLRRPPIG
jgi:hypothetical protein